MAQCKIYRRMDAATFYIKQMKYGLAVFIILFAHFASAADDFARVLSGSEKGKAILSLNPRILTDLVRNKLENNTFQP